jgi:hypothetical protein
VRAAELDTVVIYDDEEDQRRRRAVSALRVCEMLVEDGALTGVPTIQATGLRQDTLQALAEGGQTLLLADLMAHDDSPRGARILRAVSAREDVASRTWRIALTRLADPRVALMLRGNVNAVVVYDDTDIEPIAGAVKHTLAGASAVPEAPPTYPDRIEQRYPEDLDARLREALHGDYTAADAEAAFRWIGRASNEITPETDASRSPGFLSTDELGPRVERLAGVLKQPVDDPLEIRALQQKLKRRSPGLDVAQIYARVHRCLWAVSPAGLHETITPDSVRFAMEPDNVIAAGEWEESKDSTWLTREEHDAAWMLIKRAHRLLQQRRVQEQPRSRRKKYGTRDARLALNEVFGDETLVQALADKGLQMWDAHYAVCSIVDWLIDREDSKFVTVG